MNKESLRVMRRQSEDAIRNAGNLKLTGTEFETWKFLHNLIIAILED